MELEVAMKSRQERQKLDSDAHWWWSIGQDAWCLSVNCTEYSSDEKFNELYGPADFVPGFGYGIRQRDLDMVGVITPMGSRGFSVQGWYHFSTELHHYWMHAPYVTAFLDCSKPRAALPSLYNSQSCKTSQ